MAYYPITVIAARYGGTYEGGPWVAFHARAQHIPAAATGSDVTCAEWYATNSAVIATGINPSAAVIGLKAKIDLGLPTHPYLYPDNQDTVKVANIYGPFDAGPDWMFYRSGRLLDRADWPAWVHSLVAHRLLAAPDDESSGF